MSVHRPDGPITGAERSGLGEPEADELVVGGTDVGERDAEPLLGGRLRRRAGEVVLLGRIVAAIEQVRTRSPGIRPERANVVGGERLLDDGHVGARVRDDSESGFGFGIRIWGRFVTGMVDSRLEYIVSGALPGTGDRMYFVPSATIPTSVPQ